ncbi:hypothetical protein BGAL_0146g00070 [Botrytis galanthina]|uniref:Ig-like domain-containing protein n=1 Tax=Botrytis galanthina TaxID=278940 RepID=A0A4S8R0S3_9HELO|nr:hypothetical protein BGAL_0146g00070 [Botrytis galanthina]
MYPPIILVGVLPLIQCLSLSSGSSSAVTTPIYLATPSITQSSPTIVSSTTSISAHSWLSPVSSGLSSLSSISNHPPTTSTSSVIETTTIEFLTTSTTATSATSDSSSASSSSACPTLVARNDEDDDAALLAAMAYWESIFNNTDYLSLDDTISQAIQLANSTDGYDPDMPTTDSPPTNPVTPPTNPNSPIIPDPCPPAPPKKRHRNAAEKFDLGYIGNGDFKTRTGLLFAGCFNGKTRRNSKSSSTTAYRSSTYSFGFSSITTFASSRISTGGTTPPFISSVTSSSSGGTLHTSTTFPSSLSSISSTTTFPSDTSVLSSVSSSDLTTSTTTSTSSTTSCSATPSSTNPCPELQTVGNDPDPLDEDKPITDEKVAECENWLESNVEPPEGPTDSPEYIAWDQMRDRCSRIENVDKNVAIRKEYILQQSSVFRCECVQEAVAWLKKHADKIPGLPEWLEEHKDDWHSPCGPGI